MIARISLVFVLTSFLFPITGQAQIDQTQLGAWYMYFWNAEFKNPRIGLQGDVQFRNWDYGADFEQLLIRGGVYWNPEGTKLKLTAGAANITSGTFGESDDTKLETRIYQEALFPQDLSERIHLNHRFRFEERFVEDQDLRTRFRYNLFINVGLNNKAITTGTYYLALYNEIFINGQKETGLGKVEIFDRNRTYAALGYCFRQNLKFQLGYMRQMTDNWSKGQFQVSMHHNIGRSE